MDLGTLRKLDIVGIKGRTSVLLTPVEAARILHTTAGTLAVWRSKKRYPLPFVRVGRRVYYRLQDVEKFISLRTDPGIRCGSVAVT